MSLAVDRRRCRDIEKELEHLSTRLEVDTNLSLYLRRFLAEKMTILRMEKLALEICNSI